MSDETRTRFLAAIAAQVGADRVEEAHVFAPIRQGGMESGVAVVAVGAAEGGARPAPPSETPGDVAPADPEVTQPHGDPLAAKIVGDGADAPPAMEGEDGAAPDHDATSRAARAGRRLTVYTAKYRLTLKGPDRGKWEFAMQAEADAPLITVETVVRGVQRRSGDVDDPEKLSGDEFRAQLPGAGAGA